MTPLMSIHANCKECVGGTKQDVFLCTGTTCKLYPYRMGKLVAKAPRKKRILTQEQKEILKERLIKARGAKHKKVKKEVDG